MIDSWSMIFGWLLGAGTILFIVGIRYYLKRINKLKGDKK